MVLTSCGLGLQFEFHTGLSAFTWLEKVTWHSLGSLPDHAGAPWAGCARSVGGGAPWPGAPLRSLSCQDLPAKLPSCPCSILISSLSTNNKGVILFIQKVANCE